MAAGTGAMFRARTELDAQLFLQEFDLRHGRRPLHSRQDLLRLAPWAGAALAAAWAVASLVD